MDGRTCLTSWDPSVERGPNKERKNDHFICKWSDSKNEASNVKRDNTNDAHITIQISWVLTLKSYTFDDGMT